MLRNKNRGDDNCRAALRWCVMPSLVVALLATSADAQRTVRQRDGASSASDFAAKRLLKRGQDFLTVGEEDRGVKMLESVVEQYPDSNIRYEAWLALGRYHIDVFQQPKALLYLARLRDIEQLDQDKFKGDIKEWFLESLYLTGVAYYQTKQFPRAFPVLRKITTKYQNTIWANQAYYYIGMCHFAQGNWNKAIEALNLVGTFIDPNSPEVEFVEAGRRFYVKIEDGDLPVLESLDKKITLKLKTQSGDEEVVVATPLPGKQTVYISSTPTAIGNAHSADGTLQVLGRDIVTVTYYDDNTKSGDKDTPREKTVKVVSTGAVSYTGATFDTKAEAAFLKQPLFVLVQDADEDQTENADKVQVRIVCRFKVKTEDLETGEADVAPTRDEFGLAEEPEQYEIRDEVTLTLQELEAAVVDGDAAGSKPKLVSGGGTHTGRFGGSTFVDAYSKDKNIDKADDILMADVDDEIIITFIDDLHTGGQNRRLATAKITVAGELNTNVAARQNIVTDEVLKARKNIVEATALLELARLFNSMGLKDGAASKAEEGIGRVDPIIRVGTPIPSSFKEQAFRIKWETYIAQEEYAQAIETCKLFNRLYPKSPLVDRAMIGIAEIKSKEKDYQSAIGIYKQVLGLPTSQSKGEAQYRIAESLEAIQQEKADASPELEYSIKDAEGAVQAYKLCAEKYPDSPFAGPSLAKLIDYYMEVRDHVQADDLLQQVFDRYPDAEFLDQMLLRWVKVAYRMGNTQKAYDKCQQLVFEYPGSIHAEAAKKIMPALEKKLNVRTEPATDTATNTEAGE